MMKNAGYFSSDILRQILGSSFNHLRKIQVKTNSKYQINSTT